MTEIITLYPSNWLYNAGVIGLLSCIERNDYLKSWDANEEEFILKNNFLILNKNIFKKINVRKNYFEDGTVVNLKGKNALYPNFIDTQGNQISSFIEYVKGLSNISNCKKNCGLCNNPVYINEDIIDKIKRKDAGKKFLEKIEKLDMVHNNLLGPSKKFPNAYWNTNDKLEICHFCSFILIHQHLAFTKLSDGSEIFINAPSFKMMYELNKIIRELFGKDDMGENKRREILAMSMIEYSKRLNTSIGMWNVMNVEMIIRRKDLIDFYTLPYEVTNLLLDRQIASLLSDIGEFSVLNIVLNQEETKLLDLGYKLLRIGFKQQQNKNDRSIVGNFLHNKKNKNNLIGTSKKILKLYSNIIERRESYV